VVDNLARHDVSLLSLVWERGINYDSIEVIWIIVYFLRDGTQVRVVVVVLEEEMVRHVQQGQIQKFRSSEGLICPIHYF